MLNFKGMRFPIDVILVCIRWYAAYPLSGFVAQIGPVQRSSVGAG